MQHRGHKVESVVRSSRYSLKSICDQLHIHRNTIYNYFKNPDLPVHRIKAIGAVIEHDFSEEFPYLLDGNLVEEPQVDYISESRCRKDLTELYKKYTKLLEQHMELRDAYSAIQNAQESA